MKNKKIDKIKCSVLRFLVSLCIFIGFTFVLFDLRVNAADNVQVVQTSLPYYIDPDNFQFTNSDFYNAYDNTEAGGRYNSILSQFDTKKYLIVFEEYALGGEIYTYYQINTNNGLSLNGTPYADFNPMNDTLTWSFSAYKLKFIYRDGVLAHTSTTATDTNYVINLLGFDSQTYGADPLLIKETEYWLDAPVLVLGAVPGADVIPGHVVPPGQGHSIGNFSNSDYTGSGQLPREHVPPEYTINNYTWTTVNPPPFDNSSTLDALESIGEINKYYFEWLADNLKNEFENLIDNIEGFFNYIGALITYYGDLIIDNIQAFAQNIYDNFESLFLPFYETVKDFIGFFIHPFDSTQAQYDISNSAFITQISTTKTQLQTFVGSFNSITEPNNVVYTMDFTNLYYNFGVWVIDFSIISPVLPYIRTVIAAILLYSLIVNIFTSINAYIGGNSSKNESD